MSLQDDTRIVRNSNGFVANLLPEWGIWGPNGGFMSSIALRAAGEVAGAGQRPISLSVQYVGRAAFGPVDVTVTPIKTGASACFVVSLRQGDTLVLQAQVWTSSRDAGPDVRPVAPAVPGPDEIETLASIMAREGKPLHPFWQHFDAAPIGGAEPGSSTMRQWSRFHDWETAGDLFLDACRSVLLIDTLIWPAHARARNPTYVAPSLDLTVWFHEPAGAADWLLADVHADTAGAGVIHGGARIWTQDGRAIASGGSQLLVVPAR